MKRWQKVLTGIVVALVVVVAAIVTFIEIRWDRRYDIAGPDLVASADSAVIARGQYLVRGPAHCNSCHVASFEEMVRAEAGEALAMRGGVEFPMGPVGTLSPSNLTPDNETGIGRYTDQQLFRLLRHGIKPDGTATLTVLMPFQMMADEDLVAIVSYLRSLEPIRNEVKPPHYTLLGKGLRLMTAAFQPWLDHQAPATAPPQEPTAERGEYIARYVANCVGCHTAHDFATMQFTGPEFAGGAEFGAPPDFPGADPNVVFRSPNLTPHPTGALVRYPTPEAWMARFRAGPIHAGSPMYWGSFGRMSDADLEALWVFFNSLEPVEFEIGPSVVRKEG